MPTPKTLKKSSASHSFIHLSPYLRHNHRRRQADLIWKSPQLFHHRRHRPIHHRRHTPLFDSPPILMDMMPAIFGKKGATDEWLDRSSSSKFESLLEPYEEPDLVAALNFGDFYNVQYVNEYNIFIGQLQTVLPTNTDITNAYTKLFPKQT